MHSGVKYTDRNNSQPATSIPKGASLSDILLPTDNVFLLALHVIQLVDGEKNRYFHHF